jgi:hypothetical protein
MFTCSHSTGNMTVRLSVPLLKGQVKIVQAAVGFRFGRGGLERSVHITTPHTMKDGFIVGLPAHCSYSKTLQLETTCSHLDGWGRRGG